MTDRTAHVMLPCSKEWERVDNVEFLDIAENMYGEDVMTYTCPACGQTHESIVVMR